MEPSFDLSLALPRRGTRDLRHALYRQLKAAIQSRRLLPGVRLPATRELAGALGVSRNTVVAAYEELLAEGYLLTNRGAGTRVADVLARAGRVKAALRKDSRDIPVARSRLNEIYRHTPWFVHALSSKPTRFDFRVGYPELGHLRHDIWNRLSARSVRARSKAIAAYGDPRGEPALRDAIARHVSYARAVACSFEHIIVTAGAQQAFDLLARVLVVPGRTVVAIENPGYPPLRAAFAAHGAIIAAVPVDGQGLVVERLPANAGVVCVTPSHQFPLGMPMSARRRSELLDFADRRGASVIEDDYDGEFRFGGQPLDALQTLDRSASVFYLGTFSKSLFPALRIGFVAAPSWAYPALVNAKRIADRFTPLQHQDALAAFIAEGHLMRHVRKMRNIYDARRTALLHALARYGSGLFEPIHGLAGLHVAARTQRQVAIGALIERAAEAGIALDSLAQYAYGKGIVSGIAFGYGSIREDDIDPAIAKLVRLMR